MRLGVPSAPQPQRVCPRLELHTKRSALQSIFPEIELGLFSGKLSDAHRSFDKGAAAAAAGKKSRGQVSTSAPESIFAYAY